MADSIPGSSSPYPGPARSDWRGHLIAELGRLGPDISSRVLAVAPSAADIVPAERFHDRVFLRRAIDDCGMSLVGARDSMADSAEVRPAVAASRFTRHYVSSITAAALVALAQGVGLDLSANRCVMVVRQGMPRQLLVGPMDERVRICRERPTTWPVEGSVVRGVEDLREYVWRRLYAAHLAPLFAIITDLTGASPRLLWSNAAEWVAQVADVATEHLAPAAATVLHKEAAAVLDANTLPGIDGANPLKGLVEWVDVDAPDFPRGLQTRRHCCITYLLPARLGRLCENCPFLSIPDRVALCRETRMNGPTRGGPAELRSIEIGLGKIRTRSRPGSDA
jgi:hypothetical protein